MTLFCVLPGDRGPILPSYSLSGQGQHLEGKVCSSHFPQTQRCLTQCCHSTLRAVPSSKWGLPGAPGQAWGSQPGCSRRGGTAVLAWGAAAQESQEKVRLEPHGPGQSGLCRRRGCWSGEEGKASVWGQRVGRGEQLTWARTDIQWPLPPWCSQTGGHEQRWARTGPRAWSAGGSR